MTDTTTPDITPDNTEPYPTIYQELRSLEWICSRVLRLSPAGRRWLREWIDSTLWVETP